MSNTHERRGSLLKAESVCLSFGDKQVLRDVSLDIRNIVRPGATQGQVAALIGRSGIGKTQLFRIMAGFGRATTGRVLIGEDQHEVSVGEVGVVSQAYTLLRRRTIRSNLAVALSASGIEMSNAQLNTAVEQHAADLDLYEHLDKYPKNLSGGQRQRVAILQQLLTGNHTVFMDEPFSGLDVLMVNEVLKLIQRVTSMHELNTVVVVSHDIESALAISDQAFVLARQPDLPGATVTREFDLADMGLAYDPGIRDRTAFRDVVREVTQAL